MNNVDDKVVTIKQFSKWAELAGGGFLQVRDPLGGEQRPAADRGRGR